LEEVLVKLSFLKIHRIFIVDDKRMPIGVISLSDVLKTVLDYLAHR